MKIIYSGYAEKAHPKYNTFKRRLLILSDDSIYWFKHEEGQELFGEKRARVKLRDVKYARIVEDSKSLFEFSDVVKHTFKCNSNDEAKEWVKMLKKRICSHDFNETFLEGIEPDIVKISFVSVIQQYSDSTEIVIAKNLNWGDALSLNRLNKNDMLNVNLSDKESIQIPEDLLLLQIPATGREFEVYSNSWTLTVALTVQNTNARVGQIATVPAGTSVVLGNALGATTKVHLESICLGFLSCIFSILCMNTLLQVKLSAILNVYLLILTMLLVYSYMRAIYSHTGNTSSGKGLPSTATGQTPSPCQRFQLVLVKCTKTSEKDRARASEKGRARASETPATSTVPPLFLQACDNDAAESSKRWEATKLWRASEGVDSILTEPQPHFHAIKTYYPHYVCGRGKLGHCVYYERLGELQMAPLKARGVTVSLLLRHWIFVTEYQWRHVAPEPTACSIAVLDMEGCTFNSLTSGDMLELGRKMISIANAHYPERSYVVFMVNVPSWYSFCWRLAKPLVNEKTQAKIKILSKRELLAGLLEHIDLSEIPIYYGGQKSFGGDDPDNCRRQSPDEVGLYEYVHRLNDGNSAADRGSSLCSAAEGVSTEVDDPSPASPIRLSSSSSRSMGGGASFRSVESSSPRAARNEERHASVTGTDTIDLSKRGDMNTSTSKGGGFRVESSIDVSTRSTTTTAAGRSTWMEAAGRSLLDLSTGRGDVVRSSNKRSGTLDVSQSRAIDGSGRGGAGDLDSSFRSYGTRGGGGERESGLSLLDDDCLDVTTRGDRARVDTVGGLSVDSDSIADKSSVSSVSMESPSGKAPRKRQSTWQRLMGR